MQGMTPRSPDVAMAEEVLVGLNTIFPVLKRLYGVKKVGIFGCFARRDPGTIDAIELLVEFSPGYETYRHYLGLKWHLEEYFSTKFDIITTRVLTATPSAESSDLVAGEVDEEALLQILSEVDFLYTRCKDLTPEAFARDPLLRRAAERSIQIMHLAARRVSNACIEMNTGIPWKEFQGISQSIAETRYGADSFLLWHFIVTEGPGLQKTIRAAVRTTSAHPHRGKERKPRESPQGDSLAGSNPARQETPGD